MNLTGPKAFIEVTISLQKISLAYDIGEGDQRKALTQDYGIHYNTHSEHKHILSCGDDTQPLVQYEQRIFS